VQLFHRTVNIHMYYRRQIESVLQHYTTIFPVVGLTGPRQSGKSTLLSHLFRDDYTYVSFDDFKTTTLFYDDPEKFMTIYNDRVVFDEVQKVPEIFNHIKIAVDRDRENYGKFILTGSSNFLLLRQTTESLAGRIGLLSLLPFQYSEIPEKLQKDSIFRGGYPELVKRQYAHTDEWYSSYLETYLSRDIRTVSNIGDLHDFKRFIRLLSANTAQILNLSNYSKDIGVAVSTIKRWVSVLEASFVIFLLQPYFNNYGKRIVKSPKVYFYDTGLVSFLAGISTEAFFEQGPMAGSIFENYVISELLKKELHQGGRGQFYYLRTSHGNEIDLIIDRAGSQDFIEIKNSATFKPAMTKMIEEYKDRKQRGYLLYRGSTVPYLPDIVIQNYSKLLAATEE